MASGTLLVSVTSGLGQMRRWRMGLAGLALLAGCAEIVGLTGDYREGGDPSDAGSAGQATDAGSGGDGDPGTGGTGPGGQPSGGASGRPSGGGTSPGTGGGSGTGPRGGAGGDAGTGGDAAAGGDAGAGTGGTSTRPSCAGLGSTCGLDGTSDCCEATLVEGGTFDRSNDSAYPATLHSFELDVFEVTVGRFRRFAEAYADGYTPPAGAGRNSHNPADTGWKSEWNAELPADTEALVSQNAGVRCLDEDWPPNFWTWTDTPSGNETRPMNCLDWYLAYAFCIWDDARLPTEAEWNYAAAGGALQRVFPWSDPPDLDTIGETYASFYVDVTRQCCGDGENGCEPTDFSFVGTKKDGYGRWGQADLSGNVWEWVQDLYAPYGASCIDCANLTSGTQRIGRGGGYVSYWGLLRTESRVDFSPDYRSSAFGVRCARNVAP